MAQIFIDPKDYGKHYYQAQLQARRFFLPFNEYERLAGNKIREDLPPNIPKVNDGSLAAMLMDTPMRVIAQNFSGNAKVTESIDPQTNEAVMPQSWLQEVVNFAWQKKIIPNANTQAPFFNKWQVALYRALIFGSCPIYSFYTSRGNYRGSDLIIPYVRDVYLEPGKGSDQDSDFIFMDTYFTRLQIENIIAHAEDLQSQGVETSWDTDALRKVLNSGGRDEKEYLAKNPAERNRPVHAEQWKFTTIFQRGVQAPFETFYLQGEFGPHTIVRTKYNEDPTGDVPIHFLYAYEDLINPYGKGQIEVSGGTQNVLDYLVQLHVLGTQIGLQPPIEIRGDRSTTDLDSLVYAPSQFWFSGNAVIDIKDTASSIYKEFPQTYGMYYSQLANMQGKGTVQVSAESAGPAHGKTPAAIAQTQQTENAHDNFLRGQVASAFEKVAKSMINIHFANMQGVDIERLEADDARKLSIAGLIPVDPQTGKPQTNEIELDWDHLRGKFDFEVDPDSSIVKDDQQQVSKLSEILDLIQQNPYLMEYIQATGYELDLGEVYRAIFTKIGLLDIDKILKPLPEDQMGNTPPPMAFDKPKIELKYDMIPPEGQVQLLQHAGINVSLADVLAGPVLNPNERGVEVPVQDPNVRLPDGSAGAELPPQPGTPPPSPASPTPSQTDKGTPMAPAKPAQNPAPALPPGAPQAPMAPPAGHPLAGMGGMNPAQVHLAIAEARKQGIPEDEIVKYLKSKRHLQAPAGSGVK